MTVHCTSIKNNDGKHHFKCLNFVFDYLRLYCKLRVHSKRRKEDMFTLDQNTNLFIQTKYIRHQFANILPF